MGTSLLMNTPLFRCSPPPPRPGQGNPLFFPLAKEKKREFRQEAGSEKRENPRCLLTQRTNLWAGYKDGRPITHPTSSGGVTAKLQRKEKGGGPGGRGKKELKF